MANAALGGLLLEISSVTDAERQLARESAKTLRPYLKRVVAPVLKLEADGEARELGIPAPALPLIAELLRALGAGKSVAIQVLEDVMTTQEAADLLQVSHPFLVGLLEKEEIAYFGVGNQRRLKKADVLAYQQRRKEQGMAALREMARLDQAMGLYK
jgi:excisionase family DNA binding protein